MFGGQTPRCPGDGGSIGEKHTSGGLGSVPGIEVGGAGGTARWGS